MKKLAGLLAAVVLLSTTAARAQPWTFDTVVYGWLTGLDGTIGIGDRSLEVPVDAEFSDLLEYADFAMAVHFEARNPTISLITDIAYFNLGSERDATVLKQPVEIDLDFKEWVFELGAGYHVTPEADVILAGRAYVFETALDTSSDFGGTSGSSTHSWADIFIGARYRRSYETWFWSVRGDIGTGGSEFAWFVNAIGGYRFNETVAAGLAWRMLGLDREADTSEQEFLHYDVNQGGLGLGVAFSF